MGNCCSDHAGGRSAVGGTAASHANPNGGPNDAVDRFLQSRGYQGLFSQIEVGFAYATPSLFSVHNRVDFDEFESIYAVFFWWID